MKTTELYSNDIIKNWMISSNEQKMNISVKGGSSFTAMFNEYGVGTIAGLILHNSISTLIFNVNFTKKMRCCIYMWRRSIW